MDSITSAFNRGANGEPCEPTCHTSTIDRAYRLGRLLRCSSTRVWAGRGHKVNVQRPHGVFAYDFAADEDKPREVCECLIMPASVGLR